MAEERREVKSKRERGRYTQMNAEFQRTARDEKVFFSEQSKEIDENNKMGKTTDLFKKIRANKGTIHERMNMIKNRNSKDPTETEEIKKRLQEYTDKLLKKGF